MPAANLSVERFVITTSARGGEISLHTVFNRYRRLSGGGLSPGKPGIAIFLSHGAGHHKEMWEPTIAHLFQLDDKNSSAVHIEEAWALDGQNHGESAALNADIFSKIPFAPVYECGDAFASLYTSGHLGSLDPKVHKVIMIGHSAGAVIAVLSTHFFPGSPSAIPYSALILVEPAIVPQEMIGRETQVYHAVKGMTPMRRDTWESREVAKGWLQKRIPWSLWDPRVLDAYVKHGLTPLPTPLYPDKTGVTLTTPKSEEARVYDCTTEALHALYRLNQIATTVPIHLIFGDREELYPVEIQDALNDPAQGRAIASISRISNAGHLVVQEAPGRLADGLFTIISSPAKAIKSNI